MSVSLLTELLRDEPGIRAAVLLDAAGRRLDVFTRGRAPVVPIEAAVRKAFGFMKEHAKLGPGGAPASWVALYAEAQVTIMPTGGGVLGLVAARDVDVRILEATAAAVAARHRELPEGPSADVGEVPPRSASSSQSSPGPVRALLMNWEVPTPGRRPSRGAVGLPVMRHLLRVFTRYRPADGRMLLEAELARRALQPMDVEARVLNELLSFAMQHVADPVLRERFLAEVLQDDGGDGDT